MAGAEGALRSAEALLRVNGGGVVLLRMPAAAVPGSVAEELGLVTPEFQDVVLWPAVFRKAESTATLLVSASAIAAVVGSLAFASADVLFKTAAGVVVDGVLYAVTDVVTEEAQGTAYCYAVTLRAPTW
jgi:hypothetical protein